MNSEPSESAGSTANPAPSAVPTLVPKKPIYEGKDLSIRRTIVINNSKTDEPMAREEVPVQKKIRVLPEHEGKYKIIMPEGTTLRTKRLLDNRRKIVIILNDFLVCRITHCKF